ncbi:hypothetical protein H8S90_08940 [Olivibacter sp. SDN3]|uniref:hypothetical protein n=1 Tax=Olivibacter sp. SDN3 TaxID=2764720 RepID=UPI001650E84B|nr:hypothetical protein [Olivibacter sp. SDN3]QNL51678.1 hypothetical protein H8S90_08940 [Olivibacter sp. SDN3]
MNNETFSPSLLLTIILFAMIAFIGIVSCFVFFPITTSFISLALVALIIRFFIRKPITYFRNEAESEVYSDTFLKLGDPKK